MRADQAPCVRSSVNPDRTAATCKEHRPVTGRPDQFRRTRADSQFDRARRLRPLTGDAACGEHGAIRLAAAARSPRGGFVLIMGAINRRPRRPQDGAWRLQTSAVQGSDSLRHTNGQEPSCMGRCARFAAILLTLGPAGAGGVIVGPPAESVHEPAAWFKNIEYPGPGAWEWLLKLQDDSAVWLYTRQNFARSGSAVSVWRRIEFRDPQVATTVSTLWSGTYVSLVERVDVDCNNPSERRRAATAYRGRNMTEPIEPALVVDEGHSSWQPAIPGTERAEFASRVCARFQSHRMQPH
jgi:hypothetical protein